MNDIRLSIIRYLIKKNNNEDTGLLVMSITFILAQIYFIYQHCYFSLQKFYLRMTIKYYRYKRIIKDRGYIS